MMEIDNIYNCDCVDGMQELPTGHKYCIVTDPPYGVSYARGKNGYGVTVDKPYLSLPPLRHREQGGGSYNTKQHFNYRRYESNETL